ncbi:hypothetical protein BT63DRAFT_419483 [Microthyrium microscopicum]|uniref:Mid2 domain-containing protein n=1 Tax=Microthyrium microscopicum TaxID=703497 RepID=A0A6A6UR04_9PEZI|nr:hypothetical protein BT63DRAFT_419483 [Microthyrium microscopicum]
MATYYLNHKNILGKSASIPCGVTNSTTPYVPCCVKGDTCMSDGICQYTHSLAGGTGFYVSDCTDATFGASTCKKACSSNPVSDIVYDATTGVWQCCSYPATTGTPVLNCTAPTNERFYAPAPANLVSVQQIPSNGQPTYLSGVGSASSTSPASSSSLSTSTAATTTPATSSSSSYGLSTGTKAGIGVGTAISVFAIVGIIAFIIFRKSKNGKSSEMTTVGNGSYPDHSCATHTPKVAASTEPPMIYQSHELDSGMEQRHELGTS